MLEDNQPRRRGRPPREDSDDLAENIAVEAPETSPSARVRRRRPNTGEHKMKLNAPSREGEHRHWFNDKDGRIAEVRELGYEFVSDTGVKTDQPGSRIARRVGTQENGEPLYSYLMETPDKLYQQGVDEREREHAKVDAAIEAGRDFTGRLTSQESYGQGSIKIER